MLNTDYNKSTLWETNKRHIKCSFEINKTSLSLANRIFIHQFHISLIACISYVLMHFKTEGIYSIVLMGHALLYVCVTNLWFSVTSRTSIRLCDISMVFCHSMHFHTSMWQIHYFLSHQALSLFYVKNLWSSVTSGISIHLCDKYMIFYRTMHFLCGKSLICSHTIFFWMLNLWFIPTAFTSILSRCKSMRHCVFIFIKNNAFLFHCYC